MSAGLMNGSAFTSVFSEGATGSPPSPDELDCKFESISGVSWLKLLFRGGNLLAGLSSWEVWLLADGG